jgi:hypothetical protein
MNSSSSTLNAKGKKKQVGKLPPSAAYIASDLVDWIFAYCKFINKEEAIKLLQGMLDLSYLIPTERVDTAQTFANNSTTYIFQVTLSRFFIMYLHYSKIFLWPVAFVVRDARMGAYRIR